MIVNNVVNVSIFRSKFYLLNLRIFKDIINANAIKR